MRAPFAFRDKGLLAGVLALLASEPGLRRPEAFRRLMRPPRAPRWMRRSGSLGPFNREREAERRRRQMAAGMLKF